MKSRWICSVLASGALAMLIAGAALSCAQQSGNHTPSTTAPSATASTHTPAVAATRPAARRPDGALAQPQSEKEYLAQAAELRAIYSQPPQRWPKPMLDPGVEHREIGKLPPVEFPADNPFTKEKEALGRELFFDPRLSGSAQIACASCHDPDLAWADGRTVSFGHSRTVLKRNSPSILFAAYQKSLFWDGRATSLEDQFHGPVTSADEMNAELDKVAQSLDAIPGYREQFKKVFGAEHVKMEDAAKAVATFQRYLATLTGRNRFDKFMQGDSKAMSDAAIRGMHIFRTSGRCMNCHNGPLFSDGQFHNLGFHFYGRKYEDLGRYTVTKDPKDSGRFRTPSLRDVEHTKPYMHLGTLSLEGVVAAYNMGMANPPPTSAQVGDPLFPQRDPLLKRLGLGSTEKADLIEFLRSLSETPMRVRPPELPGMPTVASKHAAPTESSKSE
jgi:cytochrome c peroxidase